MPGPSLRVPRVSGLVMGQPGAAPHLNQLLWSEELQQAIWTKANATVTADTDGRADRVQFTVTTGQLSQLSSIAASTGATVQSTETLTADYTRQSITGIFDGVSYTFSGEVKDNGTGGDIRFQITRSGGFLLCIVRDVGDGVDFLARDFQLEVGPTFTTYVKREGT